MEVNQQHEAVADWLGRPAAYPHHPPRVEEVQTHISRVFLARDRVYKLKKPAGWLWVAANHSLWRQLAWSTRRPG